MNRRNFLKALSALACGVPICKIIKPAAASRANSQIEAMNRAMIIRRSERAAAERAFVDEHQQWLTEEQFEDFRHFITIWCGGLNPPQPIPHYYSSYSDFLAHLRKS